MAYGRDGRGAAGRVVVAGASGLIGVALTAALDAAGWEVVRLVRRPTVDPGEVTWAPGSEALDPAVLEGAAAVIGLNGASIGRLPWTHSYRRELVRSRLEPTRTLATALRELGEEAPAFLSASAVGYYGSAPGRVITESAPAGTTFLSDLCRAWEAAALGAGPRVRTVLLRSGSVIDRRGVLGPLARLASAGLAGPIAGGRQAWPWIALSDEVRAVIHLMSSNVEGPVNLVGPTPATAGQTVRAVALALGRPYWLPAPAWALRAALGPAAAESLLLADAHVRPAVLERSGFSFGVETVAEAVANALA